MEFIMFQSGINKANFFRIYFSFVSFWVDFQMVGMLEQNPARRN